MRAITITQARKSIYQLVDQVELEHRPVHIIGKRNNAVLVSESDWNDMQATLYLKSIPGMSESIIAASKEPVSSCVKASQVKWK